MSNSKKTGLFLFVCYIVFLASMVCCFRAVSSISIALILLTGIYKNRIETGRWLNTRLNNTFLITCSLFYILQAVSLLYTTDVHETVKELQVKSALPVVPLALCCCGYIHAPVFKKQITFFIWLLAVIISFCLLLASYRYFIQHTSNTVFFYHALVSPFEQHAVQVSIYLFVALLYLLQQAVKRLHFYNRHVHLFLIFYFTCCLLLLSSKLVISFSAFCLLYFFLLMFRNNHKKRLAITVTLVAGLSMIVVVLFSHNRVSERFNEIISGNVKMVEQQQFNPAVYFNGLQFRLLQWRFVKEILNEQRAWSTGVAGAAQSLLDQKYTSTHMYTGGEAGNRRGYLGYNTHNQFLQSLLQSGLPGLLSFIMVCAAMIQLAVNRKNRALSILTALLIAYCFNEALFETQYGLMLFTFLPLFFYYGMEECRPAPVPGIQST